MKCSHCGCLKDDNALEAYPYENDGIHCGDPIEPIISIEVQPTHPDSGWRVSHLCHECWHKHFAGADMWINESIWARTNPTVLFMDLDYSTCNGQGV